MAETRGAQYVEWQARNGSSIRVPPSVKSALEAPFRGQQGLGGKAMSVLDFWADEPVLKDADQAQLGRSGSSPSRLSPRDNVTTRLVLKADHSVVRGPFAYHKINHAKLLKDILDCGAISDDEKYKLCKGGASKEAKDWMLGYEVRKKTAIARAPSAVALQEAELETLTEAERAARKRQTTLDERVVTVLTPAQVTALSYLVATFFFVCRISCAVIEHWAFIALVRGLCPAFARHMCKRVSLGSAWLGTLYADSEEKTECGSIAGIGIDISRREVCHVHPSAHLFKSSVISMVIFFTGNYR